MGDLWKQIRPKLRPIKAMLVRLLRFSRISSRFLGVPRASVWLKDLQEGAVELIREASVTQHSALPQVEGFHATEEQWQLAEWVLTLPDGRVWGHGNVITQTNLLLRDVSWTFVEHFSEHDAFRLLKYPALLTYKGRVAVISSVASDNYYHWLFESLPRLGLLEERGIVADKYVVNLDHPFHRDTLAILGLNAEQWLRGGASFHVRANELIVPSIPGPCGFPPPWVCRWLRLTFLSASDAAKVPYMPRVYFSRKTARYRKVVNEDEVLSFLQSRGFVEVDAGAYSFVEQVKIAQQAEIIVGVHGAAMSNIVFCKDDVRIIEIFNPSYVNTVYCWIAGNLGFSYEPLIAETGRQDLVDWDVGGNIFIPIAALECVLR